MPSKSSSSDPAGSQASPKPSRSVSNCRFVPAMIAGFGISGQLSTLSGTPSMSASSSAAEQFNELGWRTAVWHFPGKGSCEQSVSLVQAVPAAGVVADPVLGGIVQVGAVIAEVVHAVAVHVVELAGIPHAVPVGILLTGVGDAHAVVTEISDTVAVHVGLQRRPRIVDERTVVRGERHVVTVQVVEQILSRLAITVAVAVRVEVVDDELHVGTRHGKDVVGRVGGAGEG